MSPTLIQCSLAMTSSIGIAMQNAVTNQRSGQIIADASTSVVCALIVAKGA